MATGLTTEEKKQIEVSLASGESLRSTAKKLNRSPATVIAFSKQPQTLERIEALRADIANDFELLAKRALTNVTDKKLKTTSAYQNTLIAGIAAQRSSELRGIDKSKPNIRFRISITDPRASSEKSTEVIDVIEYEAYDSRIDNE